MSAANKGRGPARKRAAPAIEPPPAEPAAPAEPARRVGRPPRDPDARRLPIGRRLAALLEDRGLQHQDLRRITGASKSAISGWINAHTYPTLEQIVKICDALDVSADVLLGRKPLVLE